jgi:hypothetical protein
MHDINCPYCGAELEICHDDGVGYEENEIHQQQCSHCEKNFAFTTTISYSYDGEKADCLNGGDHKWEKVKSYPNYWPDRKRCRVCGEEIRGEIKK